MIKDPIERDLKRVKRELDEAEDRIDETLYQQQHLRSAIERVRVDLKPKSQGLPLDLSERVFKHFRKLIS